MQTKRSYTLNHDFVRKQACIKTKKELLLLKLNADEYLKNFNFVKKCTFLKSNIS